METKLRILIAEDHQTVREGIKLLINSQSDMEVVGEAGDGEEALKEASRLLPDLVLMDLSMPTVNGLSATKSLRSQCPKVKIIALTRHSDDGYLRQILSAGANGYILKQSSPQDLVRAIRIVGEGNSYIDPSLTHKVLDGYIATSEARRGENKQALTDREAEVLRSIARGYSNKEIAAALKLSTKTIEAHKANAMRKLGIVNRIEIVQYAIFRNWMQDS